jgi:glyoxylase-like metal-dependent hydrolase (beta-lactamase superfamily II)
MSLGEVSQISEDIYAYLQPDGSWHLNNTPAHTTHDSIIHIPERSVVFAGDLLFNGGRPLTCHA